MPVPTIDEFVMLHGMTISRICRNVDANSLTLTIGSHHEFQIHLVNHIILNKGGVQLSADEFWDLIPPSKYDHIAYDLRNCVIQHVTRYDAYADERGHLHGTLEMDIFLDGVALSIQSDSATLSH